MIGGIDQEFTGPVLEGDRDLILEIAHKQWPDLFVERSPLKGEMFLYEDRAACDSWTEHGCIDVNADKMLHVMLHEDAVTFVADSEQSVTGALARSMIEALRQRPERKVGVLPECTPTTDAETSTAPSTTTDEPSGSLVH